jgi:catechol 2,3-dioxygenase-like lactoylglutathione lyase family enzyme
MFAAPQVNIYSENVGRSVEFYRAFGFEETFRTPKEGDPIHVELVLDGFTVGVAAVESVVGDHGLELNLSKLGRRMEIVLWTDDTDAAFAGLVAAGARPLSEPHDWLGTLRLAWVADPDGNPLQLAERRS